VVPAHLSQHTEALEDYGSSIVLIFTLLAVEHIGSFAFQLFRRYEIMHYGKLDHNGVAYAKYESMLRFVQYFYICFVIGYTVNILKDIDRSILPLLFDLAMQWIVVDMVLMLAV